MPAPTPPTDPAWWTNFQALLDAQTEWPAVFPMRFIVAAEQVPAVERTFEGFELRLRPSRHGRHVAVSLDPLLASSDEVRALYERAATIPGAILL